MERRGLKNMDEKEGARTKAEKIFFWSLLFKAGSSPFAAFFRCPLLRG
jgi:hypothetical protein